MIEQEDYRTLASLGSIPAKQSVCAIARIFDHGHPMYFVYACIEHFAILY